jgi:hypothetical protein
VDGLVKDRTQCAPNGYYFIPVYDKVKLALIGVDISLFWSAFAHGKRVRNVECVCIYKLWIFYSVLLNAIIFIAGFLCN